MSNKNKLKLFIEERVKQSEKHFKKCLFLIKKEMLKEAIEYCQDQGIKPPQCSLSYESEHANLMRETAKRMLTEEKWWKRRLKNQAIQEYCMLPEVLAYRYDYGMPPEVIYYFNKKK